MRYRIVIRAWYGAEAESPEEAETVFENGEAEFISESVESIYAEYDSEDDDDGWVPS